jgi:ParB family transcriptional regulator, chromosome partitioning protein
MGIMPSLKAMAENKMDGVQKATYFKIDPRSIEFEPGFNLREEGSDLDAHISSLYEAMKAGAFIPPIDVSVVDGKIIARDGHCRTRAALRLVEEGLPYQLEARQLRGNEAECVLHMLGSAQGRPLTPLEQGRGYVRLLRYGMTVAEVAKRTGMSRTTIDNGLALANAPVDLQRMILDGTVSTQVALDTLNKHGNKAVEVLSRIVTTAQAAGVTKVTKKHTATGIKIPPKVAVSMFSATQAIRRTFDTSTDEELMAMDDEALIPVPAKELKALLSACSQVAGPTAPTNPDPDEL